MINIKPEYIATKKILGHLGSNKVIQMSTTGGLFLMFVAKSQPELIATGPHPAVCRHIATKRYPDIIWTALQKSDHVPVEFFKDVLPKYEQQTQDIRKYQGYQD